ncbi:MAG: peptide-methionine (S)-S-oxide reductase [Acidobacteria bacterium RIFCSPLOWO2_12_FULL_54_10]|nr:MAG: peptide-methionine (S)-S-oxide reductase [Acidobacteria bacterium RIFCSPLOWO2_12_FULL_54_10]
MTETREVAVLGGGCFWCTDAVFENLNGVLAVAPGYAGGHTSNPTYRDVCGGRTGHAECTRIEFDPSKISYHDLLAIFFSTHDPTTLNRQGNDSGTQYRSVVFYTGDSQREQAESLIRELNQTGEFASPIVTEVKPLDHFYQAEAYHHHYYSQNPLQPYCQIVIHPKLGKLKKRFQEILKA